MPGQDCVASVKLTLASISRKERKLTHKNILSASPYESIESLVKSSKECPRPACPSISSVARAIHPLMSITLPSLVLTRVSSTF